MNRTLPALAILLGAACSKGGLPPEEPAIRAAWESYDAAFRGGDLATVKGLVSKVRAADLAGTDPEPAFEMARAMRPLKPAVASCSVAGSTATLKVIGARDGTPMKGTILLVKEAGAWRVDKEEWAIEIKGPDDAPLTVAPPMESMPAAARAIVDRIAGEDPAKASMAWTELAARHTDSASYLAQVKPALWDERPIRFVLIEESFSGGGNSFRYFSAKPEAGSTTPVTARTVGEALRYPLWPYEDVSNSGFKGSFAEWWTTWAPKKGLPAFEP